ncbi:MAG: hypothetical protein ACFFC7_22450 [Candidatus Hermodarchaeota archaeon]
MDIGLKVQVLAIAKRQGTVLVVRIPQSGLDLSHQFIGLINCKAPFTALVAVKTDQSSWLAVQGRSEGGSCLSRLDFITSPTHARTSHYP